MLAVTSYPQDYVDACRRRMEAQLAAYDELTASLAGSGAAKARAGKALESFEPLFLDNLVLALDECFVHRTRAIEGKDGNALNEVRMLCTSILHGGGVLTADKTIKYRPEASVLKLGIGDEVTLDTGRFRQLLDAFLAEIERRFPDRT
jgi:hypothetical protein